MKKAACHVQKKPQRVDSAVLKSVLILTETTTLDFLSGCAVTIETITHYKKFSTPEFSGVVNNDI